MSVSRLEGRLEKKGVEPNVEVLGCYVLRQWELGYYRRSDTWQGAGVAGIHPQPMTSVYGVLYELSWGQLRVLDKIEGVHNGRYKPATVKVLEVTPGIGRLRSAITYELVSEDEPNVPSPKYVGRIIAAATEVGLPVEYVNDVLLGKAMFREQSAIDRVWEVVRTNS